MQAAAETARLRVRTLSLHAAVRFESAAQRATFAAALTEAVSDIVAAHTSPDRTLGGEPGRGRPFRLLVGCYPIPSTEREEP